MHFWSWCLWSTQHLCNRALDDSEADDVDLYQWIVESRATPLLGIAVDGQQLISALTGSTQQSHSYYQNNAQESC
jgi:hypothetical protein